MTGLRAFGAYRTPQLFIGDEETVVLQFLCEPNDFKFSVEHVSPTNWRKSLECTFFDGCWACEQQSGNYYQRIKVYIPVLVDGRGMILSQTAGKGSAIRGAIAALQEYGTAMNRDFSVKRSGKGKRVKYVATPLDSDSSLGYNGNINLEKAVTRLPYKDQENYYKEKR